MIFSEICQLSLPEGKLTWSGFGAWKSDDDEGSEWWVFKWWMKTFTYWWLHKVIALWISLIPGKQIQNTKLETKKSLCPLSFCSSGLAGLSPGVVFGAGAWQGWLCRGCAGPVMALSVNMVLFQLQKWDFSLNLQITVWHGEQNETKGKSISSDSHFSWR